MSCVVPANQPIYQALMDKVASYPPEKRYNAAAYKKVAESVRICNYTLYNGYMPSDVPGVGYKIAEFIDNFIRATNNTPTNNKVDTINDSSTYRYAQEAMDTARRIAAQNRPIPDTPIVNQTIVTAILSNPVDKAAITNELIKIASGSKTREEALAAIEPVLKPSIESAFIKSVSANLVREAPLVSSKIMEGIIEKSKDMTRRSARLHGKPKIHYYQDDSESEAEVEDDDETYVDDEDIDKEDLDERKKVIQAIKDVCDKKGWKFSDELIAEYDAWRSTAIQDYKIKKYSHSSPCRYIPMTEVAIAKRWATLYSESLWKQNHHIRIISALRKCCDKNKIKYEDIMVKKYIAWYRNPNNKKYTSRTVWSGGNSYTYDLFYYSATCVNTWFSTLNKVIVW